jgi:agmatine/peptidylarginine deiminase
MTNDQYVVNLIKQNTTKNVITINAKGVCPMGGSIRCLTWQLTGENAKRLILAAREQ